MRLIFTPAILLLLVALGMPAAGDTISHRDWVVTYNFPDQDTSFQSSSDYTEWSVRTRFLERIDALESNNVATLATFTFSGNSDCCGAAGPILNAVSGALDRGALVRFIVDGGVATNGVYGGTHSLTSLAARPVNPLVLSVDDSASGIMHNKLGLFDYGSTNRCVLVTSWNFTGGASSFQWNIALELLSDGLYAAFMAEAEELLAGRFHGDATKSHAHDDTSFLLDGSWGTNRVRFAPYPDGSTGGDNALSDITNAISRAQSEIVFCLNKLSRESIRDELVRAADRGVRVHGVIPQSDTMPGDTSHAVYEFLTNTTSYATTNHVHMVPAFSRADHSAVDTGEVDLVHAKYMVLDPFGERPTLIHGSANWTWSALVSTNSNDENLLFVRNPGPARMFYRHFKKVTGLFDANADFWLEPTETASAADLWTTDTNRFAVEKSEELPGRWTNLVNDIDGSTAGQRIALPTDARASFFRAFRQP